jgi:hypothetical protein
VSAQLPIRTTHSPLSYTPSPSCRQGLGKGKARGPVGCAPRTAPGEEFPSAPLRCFIGTGLIFGRTAF